MNKPFDVCCCIALLYKIPIPGATLKTVNGLSKFHCLASILGPVANVCLADTASTHSLCAEDLTTTPVLTERGRILLCLSSWLQQNRFLIKVIMFYLFCRLQLFT